MRTAAPDRSATPTDWLNAWATNAVATAFGRGTPAAPTALSATISMSPSVRKLSAVQPTARATADPSVRAQHRHHGAGWKHAQLMSKRDEGGREERQPQRERPETEPPGAWDRRCRGYWRTGKRRIVRKTGTTGIAPVLVNSPRISPRPPP